MGVQSMIKVQGGQRGEGPACVLAMATAVPPTFIPQHHFPDFFFGITHSNHLTALKHKFHRICEKSSIAKRHFYLTEDILKANPSLCPHLAPSLDARQAMAIREVPKLGMEAACRAIKEWGQPKSKLTHLIFCTSSSIDSPGADLALSKLLGLHSTIKRLMLYMQGCYGGATALRAAKDIAENNKDARVLVVCSEISIITFRGPSEEHLENLVSQAIFGDGAGAVIVGSDPINGVERPWYELHWAGSDVFPNSSSALHCQVKEAGIYIHLHRDLPAVIAASIGSILKNAFSNMQFAAEDMEAAGREGDGPAACPINYNDLFWMVQPGGRAILDQLDSKLQLDEDKLGCIRHVLREYGNMHSATVLFVMEEMRNRSLQRKLSTSGEGSEWGLLLGFGPGLSCEILLLKSVPLHC